MSQSPFAAFTEEAFMFGVPTTESIFEQLPVVAETEQLDHLTAAIQARIAAALNIPSKEVPLDQPLNSIITDSLMAARLYQQIVPKCGLPPHGLAAVSLVQFWQMSIMALAIAVSGTATAQSAALPEYDPGQAVPADLRQVGWHATTPAQQFFYNMYAHCATENPAIAQLHVALRISAPVNVAAMRRACQAFVDRHDGARAIFCVRDGLCYQKVREEVLADFKHIQALSEQVVRDTIEQANSVAWDIANDLPIKFRLYELDDHSFILHINAFHLVTDGWVMWMMLDELGKLYEAGVTGQRLSSPFSSADLPPVKQQLISYSRGEIIRLHSAEGAQLRHYWQQAMAGELADVRLKPDYPAPTHHSHGAVLTIRLDETLYQAITRFVNQEQITLYAFLLAVVQVILTKRTGQSEVRLASRLTNRLSEDVRQTLANAATAAVLRTHLSPEMTLRDVCLLAYDTAMGAIAHQGYPIVTLAEDVGVPLTEGSAPLAPIVYNLERVQADSGLARLFDPDNEEQLRWGSLPVQAVRGIEFGTWQTGDFGFFFMESSQTILCFLYYNPFLYQQATMAGIGQDIERVARLIINNPAELLRDVK